MGQFRLAWSDAGYELVEQSTGRSLRIDFTSRKLKSRLARGGRELLARAVHAKPGLRVLDATAGMGVDSLVLASRGCDVTLVERSHSLYLMLTDAIDRARRDPALAEIAARMRAIRGDARYIMAHLDRVPDAIVIDPMFPARQKTAAVRGELQLMQQFVGKDEDVRSLVLAARATGSRRVVVKRPGTGGDMPGLTPDYSLKGRASRFDVFVNAAA